MITAFERMLDRRSPRGPDTELLRLTPIETEIISLREENRQLTTYVYVMGGILLLIFLVARR